jgi:hypothetical protein
VVGFYAHGNNSGNCEMEMSEIRAMTSASHAWRVYAVEFGRAAYRRAVR